MYNQFMNKNIPMLCLIVLVGCLLLSQSAVAQKFDVSAIPELEALELLPDEEFQEKTNKIKQIPFDDPDLSYEVSIPKDWTDNIAKLKVTADDGTVGRKVLGELARYTSPTNPEYPRSFFTISAQQLTYEIGVKNWFLNYALINGLSLERLTVNNKKELEALYVEVKKDTTYIVRAKIAINGSKLILAQYYVSSWLHAKEKVMQAQAVNSFELLNLQDTPIEELKTHGFLNQSFFDYPPSWALDVSPVKSIEKMKAKLKRENIEDNLDGVIDIKLYNKVSTPTRSQVLKEFRGEFNVPNYKIGKLIEAPEFEKHKDMSFGMMQAYQLLPSSSKMIEYELWVGVLEGKNYIYLITLLTPSREEDFYLWARNIETYRLVTSKMRRHNGENNIFDFIK